MQGWLMTAGAVEVRANDIRSEVHKWGQLFHALNRGNLKETMTVTHIKRKHSLHTKRIYLRAAQEGDFDDMFEMFKDEEVMRYWYVLQPFSLMSLPDVGMALPRYTHQTPGHAHPTPKNPKQRHISRTCSPLP